METLIKTKHLSGTVASKTSFKTRDAAIRKCNSITACNGVTLSGGKYKLYKSSKLTESSGKTSWLKKGSVRVSNGYLWDKQKGKKLR